MPDRRHVHANLVSASSLDANVDERELAVGRIDALAHFVMGDGGTPSATAGGHANAADGIAADLGIDGAAWALGPAMHQRDVALFHFAPRKLLPQVAMGDVVAGDENQPAGFLVETMHDTGTRLAPDL